MLSGFDAVGFIKLPEMLFVGVQQIMNLWLPKSFVSEALPRFDVGVPVFLKGICVELFERFHPFVVGTCIHVQHFHDSQDKFDELKPNHHIFTWDDTALSRFSLNFIHHNFFVLLLFFAEIQESTGDKLSSRGILFEMRKSLQEF